MGYVKIMLSWKQCNDYENVLKFMTKTIMSINWLLKLLLRIEIRLVYAGGIKNEFNN